MSSRDSKPTPVDVSSLPHLPRSRDVADVDGFIYVIRFSTGTLKVGKARSARDRIMNHAVEAGRFGQFISRAWVSPAHSNFSANERTLIKYLQASGPAEVGNEYFAGRDFDAVLAFAANLPFATLSESEKQARRDEVERKVAKFKQFGPGWISQIPETLRAIFVPSEKFFPNADVMQEPIPGDIKERFNSVMANARPRVQFTDADELSWLDLVELQAQMLVRVAIADHRIWALQNGRFDAVTAPRDADWEDDA